MKKSFAFFISLISMILAGYSSAGAGTCSNSDLIKCLDSACSGNIGMNPGIRCQLCGSSSAGAPNDSGMKSLSVGMSARNTLSASDLKSAPNEPGARYSWASSECIKKISGCTNNDVSTVYDNLIAQSCKAAGITAEMNSLTSSINKSKSANVCDSMVLNCLTDEKHCGANFANCADDSDFNNFFSACSVGINGCDNSISDTRTNMLSQRDSAVGASGNLVSTIIKSYQSKRDAGMKAANDTCKNNSGREDCIKTVCQKNMQNKCAGESEKSIATMLCRFYDTACERLK